MAFIEWAFNRLAEGAVISLVLFAVGSLAVACCRQPVHRLRIILLTLAAAFFAPLVNMAPGVPHWTLPKFVKQTVSVPASTNESAISGVAVADVSERVSFAEQPPVGDSTEDREVQSAPPEFADNETENMDEDDAEHMSSLAGHSRSERSGAPFRSERPAAVPATVPNSVDLTRRAGFQPAVPHSGAAVPAVAVAPRFDIRLWAVAVYLAGAAALCVWWLFGAVCLWRLVRTTTPAEDECRALLTEIAGPAGQNVKLLVSSRAVQPCTFAWSCPVIVLPRDLAGEAADALSPLTRDDQRSHVTTDAQLRFCLAHEWAHVERGDVWLWSFAGLLRLVYYYQPLCWWLRGQLRLCQDYLADAAAARLASPTVYAEFLTTRAAGGPLAVGLGIAGSPSELYRRVAMLVQNPLKLEVRCSKGWTVATVCTGVALTLLAATFSGHPDVRADETTASGAATEPAGTTRRQPANKPAATLDATKKQSAKSEAPEHVADAANTESGISHAARNRLLERLATRSTRCAGGTILFERKYVPIPGENQIARSEWLSFMMFGSTWILRDDQRPMARAGGSPGPGAAAPAGMPMGMMKEMSAPSPQSSFTLVEGGRCWQGSLAEDSPASGDANTIRLRLARGSTLFVRHAEAVANVRERQTPFGFGTIYYESGRRFIRKHATAAKFQGIEQLEIPVFKGTGTAKLRTRVIEWNVAGEDAGEAFPKQNAFLDRGGVLKVYVAEELDDMVARIEGIDRFGTVQFSATFFHSQTNKPGTFPAGARFDNGESQIEYTAAEMIPAAPKTDSVRFVFGIPARVRVVDERLKKADPLPENVEPDGFFQPNYDEYPFHTFTTTVSYRDGFPKKLLDEIDRDVLPWNAALNLRSNDSQIGGRGRAGSGPSMMGMSGLSNSGTGPGGRRKRAVTTGPSMPGSAAAATSGNAATVPAANPASPAAAASTTTGTTDQPPENVEPPATDSGKTDNRPPLKVFYYGGKNFGEWRQMLVDDLEPETRVKALEAIGTFGANGYAAEAAEAIAGVLLTGREQHNNDRGVLRAACAALSRLGAAGVPVLQDQLGGDEVSYRYFAIDSLVRLSRSTNAALPALLKASQDADDRNRLEAYMALADRFLSSPEAFDALHAALKTDVAQIRSQIIDKLKNRKLPADKAIELLRPLLGDENEFVRKDAAVVFTIRAPGTDENVAVLKTSLLDSSRPVRTFFIRELMNSWDPKAGPDPELIVPVLISLLETAELRTADSGNSQVICISMIGDLATAKIAVTATPVLIWLVEDNTSIASTDPIGQFAARVKAIESLGKFGRGAKAAVPALKRRLEEIKDEKTETLPAQVQNSTGLVSVGDYQSLIQSAIRKIDGE